ncbi:AAA family ATPase [Lentzea terrae]|uniref:AAA family ATPase n=1 Tax=Lentzea terrae TaxID=2200761 RepID=UPI0018E57DA3|nr:MoxR family ATPase [Lentzea terrae]
MTYTTNGDPRSAAAGFQSVHDAVLAEIERAVKGKTSAIRLALACVFAGGHLLIEDVPGTGKTSLAKAIAVSTAGTFRRIQFTPDLLPTDITGVSVYKQNEGEFSFRAGPVFANVVVADEINRASPKTQSALLEVMEEGQVTADGVGYPVPTPFLVVATQNPVDMEGTYQLPEAQLDRFLMRIELGHPGLDVETELLANRAAAAPPELRAVTTLDQIGHLQHAVSQVHVAPEVARYVALLAQATRVHADLRLGVSTRGSIALIRASQAYALGRGNHFVTPDDVRALCGPVLAHRLMLTAKARVNNRSVDSVLTEVLNNVPAPAPAALW